MTNIHILCDSPKTLSGFSNVGIHLHEGLTKLGYNVSMTGFQTSHNSEFVGIDCNAMPINLQYIDELTQYMMNVQKVNAEICICIFNSDDVEQNQYAKALTPTIWYTPIEGRNIPDFQVRDLSYVGQSGKMVAQCHFGHDEMKRYGIDSTVIYHGYNPNVFRKLSNIKHNFHTNTEHIMGEKVNIIKYRDGKWNEIKVFNGNLEKEFQNKFVFGFVGSNHGIRKRIERLLKAYSLFLNTSKQLKDRTVLLLRTMPISITGINLIKICADLDISENVLFLYGDYNRLSGDTMNIIYNCMDCHVSATSSEGFGLSHLESMACGVPQIASNCSSLPELIGYDENKRGILIDGEWQMLQNGSFRFLINEQKLAEAMHIMYGREDFRESCSKNAIKFACQYTWDNVIKQWDSLIREIKIK